jgi:hypothetical protein
MIFRVANMTHLLIEARFAPPQAYWGKGYACHHKTSRDAAFGLSQRQARRSVASLRFFRCAETHAITHTVARVPATQH